LVTFVTVVVPVAATGFPFQYKIPPVLYKANTVDAGVEEPRVKPALKWADCVKVDEPVTLTGALIVVVPEINVAPEKVDVELTVSKFVIVVGALIVVVPLRYVRPVKVEVEVAVRIFVILVGPVSNVSPLTVVVPVKVAEPEDVNRFVILVGPEIVVVPFIMVVVPLPAI